MPGSAADILGTIDEADLLSYLKIIKAFTVGKN